MTVGLKKDYDETFGTGDESKSKRSKKRGTFFHERCWLCGGKFEDVQQAMKLRPGELMWDAVNMRTSERRHYNYLECKSCGLAIFMRDKAED